MSESLDCFLLYPHALHLIDNITLCTFHRTVSSASTTNAHDTGQVGARTTVTAYDLSSSLTVALPVCLGTELRLRSEHIESVVLSQDDCFGLSGLRSSIDLAGLFLGAIAIQSLELLLQVQMIQIFVVIHVNSKPALVDSLLLPEFLVPS